MIRIQITAPPGFDARALARDIRDDLYDRDIVVALPEDGVVPQSATVEIVTGDDYQYAVALKNGGVCGDWLGGPDWNGCMGGTKERRLLVSRKAAFAHKRRLSNINPGFTYAVIRVRAK